MLRTAIEKDQSCFLEFVCILALECRYAYFSITVFVNIKRCRPFSYRFFVCPCFHYFFFKTSILQHRSLCESIAVVAMRYTTRSIKTCKNTQINSINSSLSAHKQHRCVTLLKVRLINEYIFENKFNTLCFSAIFKSPAIHVTSK